MSKSTIPKINTKKSITSIKDIKMQPIKIRFDLATLNSILAFIYKDSVLRTRKVLSNIYKLFSSLDESMYVDNTELSSYIWVIQKTLYGRLYEDFVSNDLLKTYCKDQIECDELKRKIIDSIDDKQITYEESKYIVKKVDDILAFGYTVTIKDTMKEIIEEIEDGDFKTYKSVSEQLYDIATSVISIKRNSTSLGADQTFSLEDETFETVIEDAVTKLRDRNKILKTGIQRLNTILSPGYMSKRLYTYLAFPGKGKSTILLKSALDIRKYNQVSTKDPNKRPAVLFLTLENDIPETIERMYNMSVDSDDIRNYTPKQIIKKFREKGHFKLTDSDNIDIIIKEYKNRELDTNDLYTIIQDLSDDGVEVICLILDYLKRIRPAEKADSEKEELKNITNELKELAKFFDISVISAQQLNRSGASVVDAALQAKKEDVTRLVGRDAVATAWEIIENSDWVCVINPEVKADTEELFMVFKLLKRRYRSAEESETLRRLDYFAHPFTPGNEICLIDDSENDQPLSLESLSTKFVPVEQKKKKNELIPQKQEHDDEDEFDPFDFGKSDNL